MHKNKHKEIAKIRRQRNMSQIKDEKKTPETELNKMETSNPSDAEFKTLVIRIFSELRGKADELRTSTKKW